MGACAPATRGRIHQVLKFKGLERRLVDEAQAGGIVLVNGSDDIGIGRPLCAPGALPPLKIDEPALVMSFCVDTSPLAGREGKVVTCRQIRERLQREMKSNVALRMRETGDETVFEVAGRGRVRLEYRVPTCGLIGFQGEFLTLTSGTGVMSQVFDGYAPETPAEVSGRGNSPLVSPDDGEAVAYAQWKLQARSRMFASAGDRVYEGMIVGIHSRDNDLVVNPIRGKKLTIIRAAGKDDAIDLTPPIRLTLEYAVQFIADDEGVEGTPQSIRLRKRLLKEHERKRAERYAA